MEKRKIKSFTDLNAWKEGHLLVLSVYKSTKTFPKEEKLSLTDQIRRASVSITSNLAEGFSKTSKKEKVRYYTTSLASLTEVQNQLLIARDLSYLTKSGFNSLADQTITVSKLLGGLIKSTKMMDNKN